MKKVIVLILLCIGVNLVASTNYTPFADDQNWASLDYGNELAVVASEIAAVAVGISAIADVNELGENAASSSHLYPSTNRWTTWGMQYMVDSEYTSFVSGTNLLEGATNIPSTDILVNFTNWVQFATQAGISTNGWRRATTNYPANWTNLNDSAYTYGRIIVGDIIGPWNVDDLQRAFDAMTKVRYSCTWELEDTNSVTKKEGDSRDSVGSYTEMLALATSNYNDSAWTNTDDYPISFGLSQSVAEESATIDLLSIRNNAILTLLNPPNSSNDVSFYARAEKYFWFGTNPSNHAFNAQGADLVEDTWHSFDTASMSATQNVYYSDYLGNLTVPAIHAPGIPTNQTTRFSEGWDLNPSTPVAVAKYIWSYMR